MRPPRSRHRHVSHASMASARTRANTGCGSPRRHQHRFGRRVSWGASCGDLRKLFTTVSVPAMTRLRLDERRVLDTLVEGGRRAFAQPRARVVRATGRAEAGRVAERPARGALGRGEGAGRGPPLLARATARRAPSDTAASRRPGRPGRPTGRRSPTTRARTTRSNPRPRRRRRTEASSDLLAGAVEVGPDVHQALRIPTIMLTALVTITRSPRLEVLGNTLGPQASRVEHPIRVDHGHVDVAHAVDVPRLHLHDHGLALAQHGPAG